MMATMNEFKKAWILLPMLMGHTHHGAKTYRRRPLAISPFATVTLCSEIYCWIRLSITSNSLLLFVSLQNLPTGLLPEGCIKRSPVLCISACVPVTSLCSPAFLGGENASLSKFVPLIPAPLVPPSDLVPWQAGGAGSRFSHDDPLPRLLNRKSVPQPINKARQRRWRRVVE